MGTGSSSSSSIDCLNIPVKTLELESLGIYYDSAVVVYTMLDSLVSLLRQFYDLVLRWLRRRCNQDPKDGPARAHEPVDSEIVLDSCLDAWGVLVTPPGFVITVVPGVVPPSNQTPTPLQVVPSATPTCLADGEHSKPEEGSDPTSNDAHGFVVVTR